MEKKHRYSLIIQICHWLTAPLVIGLFILGIWMVELSYYDPWYQPAPDLHKSFGILLFGIMLIRVLAKISQQAPSPMRNLVHWQALLAKMTHLLMYIFIFTIIITGYLMSTASGKPVIWFEWLKIPAIISYGDVQADLAGDIHQYTAYALILLVVLHIIGFIQHQFIHKDQIIKRITPFK